MAGNASFVTKEIGIDLSLAMLEKSLNDLGVPVKPGSGVGAALEAI
jgi:hypothetical protein